MAADPVLLAAYESILEIGLRRTTLADVARRAKVSRMTVYRRYDDLDRLLAALLAAELDPLLNLPTVSPEHPGTMREQLASAIGATTLGLARHPLLARVLSVDPEALLPLIVDRLGSTQRHALTALTTKIAQAQAEDGSVRDIDPATAALMIVNITQSIVFAHRALSTELSDDTLEAEITVMVDRYLA